MDAVYQAIVSNLAVIVSMSTHPCTRLRVLDTQDAVVPRICHESRYMPSICRSITGDHRGLVIETIRKTIVLALDLLPLSTHVVDYVRTHFEQLQLGLQSIGTLYDGDMTIHLQLHLLTLTMSQMQKHLETK